MNTPKSEQIEFEVFPKTAKNDYAYLAAVKSDTSNAASQVNVIFSPQSAVIICLCLLLSLIASFTLGVEKGKKIARNTLAPASVSVAAASDKAPTDLASAPVVADAPAAATKEPALPAPILLAKKTPEPILPSGRYAIQVATVTTQNSAKSLAEKLSKKGWPSYTKPSGKYVIVLAGNYAKQEEAKTGLRELKKTYTDCFIKKI